MILESKFFLQLYFRKKKASAFGWLVGYRIKAKFGDLNLAPPIYQFWEQNRSDTGGAQLMCSAVKTVYRNACMQVKLRINKRYPKFLFDYRIFFINNGPPKRGSDGTWMIVLIFRQTETN